MAGLISQYQQSAFASPVNGAVADATVVLSNDNATRGKHNSHDADATIHVQSSLVANRPAAATAQRLWLSTDAGGVFLALDTGAAWVDINYIRTTATSLPANVLASSLTSVGVLAAPHMTAPVVDSGGMTISSGTLAAQAVTATTGTFSLNQHATTSLIVSNTDTTDTTSRGRLAAVGGTVTTTIQSVATDSGNIGTESNHPLNIITNGATRVAIAAAGGVVISGAFGCNGNAAQVKAASGGTLAGVIAALVANGILSS